MYQEAKYENQEKHIQIQYPIDMVKLNMRIFILTTRTTRV